MQAHIATQPHQAMLPLWTDLSLLSTVAPRMTCRLASQGQHPAQPGWWLFRPFKRSAAQVAAPKVLPQSEALLMVHRASTWAGQAPSKNSSDHISSPGNRNSLDLQTQGMPCDCCL